MSVKYVDWVEQVLYAAYKALDGPAGVTDEEIASKLDLDIDPYGSDWQNSRAQHAVGYAVRDLADIGLLCRHPQLQVFGESQLGRRLLERGMQELYSDWSDIYLTSHQRQFLQGAAKLAIADSDEFPPILRRDQTAQEVFEATGIQLTELQTQRTYQTIAALADLQLVADRSTLDIPKFQLRFKGLVLATEAHQLRLQRLVESLLPDWETTNVDFKQQLRLSSPTQKAEFVKDVLCLANVKVTGRRFIVIGFDSQSQKFTEGLDTSVTQDRLEDILEAHTRPVPRVQLHVVPWAGGSVGLLEILTNRHEVPYRSTVDRKPLRIGSVYTRHGTHCVPASPDEIAALEEEAERNQRV